MENLWNADDAGAIPEDPHALGVRIARLLGQSAIAPGGGSSVSVKLTEDDFFGDPVDLCCVSGDIHDLATVDGDDFASLRRDFLTKLLARDALSDVDWIEQIRAAKTLVGAPDPCGDALLHARLPYRFAILVDASAVVALTNRPDGEAEVGRVFGDRVLFVPYAMPGFALAKAVPLDLSNVHALILGGLGIVTFHDDAQQAYETLVELVTMAEERVSVDQAGDVAKAPEDLELLAELRAAVAAQRGHIVVCSLDASPEAIAYSSREDIDELAVRGPLTPRHAVHTPAVVGDDISAGLSRFAEISNAWFEQHAGPEHVMHAAPSTVVWKNRGIVSFGCSAEEAQRVADIARHASDTIQCVEAKSVWTPVAAADVFAVVFRQLAEEPLTPTPVHLGKVAVVTGAAAGIGLASAQTLAEDGATVIGLDIHPDIVESMGGIGGTGLVVDLTSDEQIIEALHTVVRTHGGLDILVSNAGIFTAGSHLEDLEPDDWDRSMAVNLTSHQRLLKHAIPYLKHGIDAAIVIMGSRNVNAPGAGAASYSCAKAALTQLCRIAALELASDGVRVNIVHPDAVFDTNLWTPEALQRSADRYGMSVEEYKSRNLMKTEIRSKNVGMMVSAVAGAPFAKTTGAQIPVDGGNDRII